MTHPSVPAFIITRDRVSYAQQCFAALARCPGVGHIRILDHGSTYLPMMQWLSGVNGHPARIDKDPETGALSRWSGVSYIGDARPRDAWTNGSITDYVVPGERFLLTDCDVVAPEEPGWVEHLHALLDHDPRLVKAGCGLRVDDIPDEFEHAIRVVDWEAKYRSIPTMRRFGETWYHEASVDTTLALYRSAYEPFALDPSARTWRDFQARHLSWYEDSANPTEEQLYYREHALPGSSHWLNPDSYEGVSA
jgi:hypothetical protein